MRTYFPWVGLGFHIIPASQALPHTCKLICQELGVLCLEMLSWFLFYVTYVYFFQKKKCLGPSAGLVNCSTDFNYFWLVEIRTAKGTVLLAVRQQLLLSFSCFTENNGFCIAVSQDCGHNNREWIKRVSISESDPINSLGVDSYSGCFDSCTIIICLLFINNYLWTHMTPEIINRLCCRVAVVSTLLVRDASRGFDLHTSSHH